MKTKWIAGIVVLCFLSALTASGLTVLMLVRGLFGTAWLRAFAQPEGTVRLTDITLESGETDVSYGYTTANPGQASPSARPSITLTPSPTPGETPAATEPAQTQETKDATEETTEITDETEPSESMNGSNPSDETDVTGNETESTSVQTSPEPGDPNATPTAKPSAAPSGPAVPTGTETDVAALWANTQLIEKIYAEAAPSVVGIKVSVTDNATSLIRTDEGSGLILDTGGTIVTNTAILAIALDKQGRLLANASVQVFVRGADQPFSARLIGKDPLTGLSILGIQPGTRKLKPAVMASDPDLKVGQLVLALGYPDLMDTEGGLASGMISGLNRTVLLESGITSQMIESDARINSICSGGPLINLQGEVIGLINCDLARSYYDNANYALPAAVVVEVAESLSDQGYIAGRPWLGITVLTETSFLELQHLYRFPDGLYISNVVLDSPAYSAGLLSGDVITKINGEDVDPAMDLSFFLQTQKVGSLVTLHVYRHTDNQTLMYKIYLQEYKR